jgi:DNA replication protein DnaC
MKNASITVQQEVILQYCKQLRAPVIASQLWRLAETAASQQQTHLDYLEALLAAEMEEREQNTMQGRIKDAHLPKVKTLDEFQFSAAPHIAASKLKELVDGSYIERAEPVLFIGDSGTGKTHLLTALCVAACRQKRRVRFTTATGIINELVANVGHAITGSRLMK